MCLGLAVCPLTLPAQSVTIAWNPGTNSNLAGYMVEYGTDGTNFDSEIDAGTNAFATVTNLTPGSTNYFEVVEYDINTNEGPPSSAIEYIVPIVAQTVTVLANPTNAGSVTGGGSFAEGSSVTVTATANSGYTFTNWTENGTVQSTSSNYNFTLAADVNLVANFTANPVTYTIATQVSPANAGSVTGGGTFVAGSSVTVTATANSGYTFANWTENGTVQSSSANYSFTLAADINLVANFTTNPVTYTVATQINPANAGSVTGGGTFVAGSSVMVTATANSGYTFTNWTENGTVQNTSANYSFTLATNRNLVANFTANPVTYTVATQVSPANAGSVAGGGTFVAGSSITVTATANSGYTFTNWTENGTVQNTSANYSFTLATNRNLVANFTANPVTYTVATQVSPANAGSVAGGGTFVAGSSITVTATANSGYTFTNWTENGTVQNTSANYNFTLATNRNLVANFTANPVNYTVATQVSPAHAGSVTGGGTFVAGSSITVTATPNSSYTFTNWTENGTVQSTSANYSFTLATNRNLVANFTANPVTYTVATQVSPANAGSVAGGGTFVAGSSITVTATANSGYTFTNWMENGTVQSTSTNYNFTLATNRNLVANFTANPVTYTVATQVSPANAGSVTGSGTFVAGSSITVTATANSGYTFTNWTANGTVQSTSANYNFTLATNRNLVANFTANPVTYTVATQINPTNAGSVTGGGTFVAGSSITVTATANSGYTFTNWTENGTVQSTSANYNFTLATNRNIIANFTANPVTYTVATQINPTNAGSVTGGGPFVAGSSVTVTATANSGYTFTNWTENGTVQSTSSNYNFTLATNRNLIANFTANPVTYTVAAKINPAYAGNVTGSGTFVAGGSVTVTATANSGYTFANWTENGTVQSSLAHYSFTAAADRDLVANFTTNSATYTVTSSAGRNGSISPKRQQTVATGGNITFTAMPANNYQVNQWLVNRVVVQIGGFTYTLQNVTSNSAVAVTFSANPTVADKSVGATTAVTNAGTNFTLLTSGNGTLAPNRHGKAFQAGKKYTVTATPAKGSVFANWVSNGIVVATIPRYSFIVESNVMLQANFIPNPFLPVMGSYHGLFYVTNGAAEESSGSFVASVTGSGAFSARLRLAGRCYSYCEAFSVTGLALKSIQRPGLTPITVQLQLNLSNGPLTGTISDGTWTADLVADAAVYSRTNPAPQTGKYTLLIPGCENASTQPGGNGFGAVTVEPSGNVIFSGILGDGTPVTSTSIVSSQGQWPLYASFYGGNGSILGWLSFTNESGISGQTGWFKLPQTAAKLYAGGFTVSNEVIGSVYQVLQRPSAPRFHLWPTYVDQWRFAAMHHRSNGSWRRQSGHRCERRPTDLQALLRHVQGQRAGSGDRRADSRQRHRFAEPEFCRGILPRNSRERQRASLTDTIRRVNLPPGPAWRPALNRLELKP